MNNVLLVGGTTVDGIGKELFSIMNGSQGMNFFSPPISHMDISSQGSIERYVERLSSSGVEINTVVYCAGVSDLRWVKDTSVEDLSRVFSVNVFGLVALVGALVKSNHPLGKVVAVVSDATDKPMRGSLAYCASKAAEEMALRCMARELAPNTVVVGVSPGVVEGTPMTNSIDEKVPEFRNWSPEESRKYADKSLVMGRRVTTREVVETIAFAMLGPDSLNGSIIKVNGGN